MVVTFFYPGGDMRAVDLGRQARGGVAPTPQSQKREAASFNENKGFVEILYNFH
jgi:hypothetical protein